MTALDGSLFLLKVGNGEDPEVFSTLGGMRATRLVINHELQDSRRIKNFAWPEIVAGAGAIALSISANGLYTDSAAEIRLRGHALAKELRHYLLCFANGDTLTGSFALSRYESSADHDSQELFAVTLESAGDMVYEPAA